MQSLSTWISLESSEGNVYLAIECYLENVIVKAMFTLTVLKTLLYEGRSVLWSPQRVTGREGIKLVNVKYSKRFRVTTALIVILWCMCMSRCLFYKYIFIYLLICLIIYLLIFLSFCLSKLIYWKSCTRINFLPVHLSWIRHVSINPN